MTDARAAAEEQILAHLRAGQLEAAATVTLRTLGPELMSYLVAVLEDKDDAADTFGAFYAMLWEGLPRFRGDCSVRTWVYVLGRRALSLSLRDRDRRRREVPLAPAVDAVAAQVRSETPEHARTASRERLAELRRSLAREDRMLLILRVNRHLSWQDVARVLSDDDSIAPEELGRLAAGLRKRFERLKDELRNKLGRPGEGE